VAPIAPTDVYAVWLLPAVSAGGTGYQLQGSAPPQLVGVIEPPVGTDGRLRVATLLPATVNGVFKLLITMQPRSSPRTPGTTVLQGFSAL
jgi:hypothetical protein